jgi:plastocyanin
MTYTRSLGALVAGLFFAPCAFFSTGCSSSSTPTGETDSGTPPADTGTVTDTGGGTETGPTCNGTPTTHDVQVGGTTYTFTPSALTICKGDTVHWVWMGGPHTVTSGNVTGGTVTMGVMMGGTGTPDNKFCNQNNMNCAMAPTEMAGNTYDFTFTTAGSFPYYCSPHATLGMIGTITVQ